MAEDNNKSVIEALLFISEKPVLIDQIKKVLNHLDAEQIRGLLGEMRAEYESQNRGIRLYEIAGGFQLITAPFLATFIKKFLAREPRADRLSRSALESLAIIAYKQPVTKLEIESLRKVNVDGIMKTLSDKNLIRVSGRRKAPGRPKLFCTTRQFLEYFGLKSLDELPKIENFPDFLVKKEDEMNLPVNTAKEVSDGS
jgi:segregation and condensation protein B